MWAAIILAGWFLLSLAAGPWIGRFVSSQSRTRQELAAPVDSQVQSNLTELPTIRQA